MKAFFETLSANVDRQLELLHLETKDPLIFSEEAIMILVKALEQLKPFCSRYKFPARKDEILFFRETKPALASQLIYYNEIYNIACNRPFGKDKVLKKYYNAELDKLKVFYKDNMEFCRYYKKGFRHLDTKYFLRGQLDVRLSLDSFYYQSDKKFATTHDYKVARILANERIKEYLESELDKLDKGSESSFPYATNTQRWTGSKVALVELVYALHTEGVFNNGKSKLSEVAAFFEMTFGVDLGHFTRVFLEIRSRRTERTKFLNTLRDKLVLRMDEADNGFK